MQRSEGFKCPGSGYGRPYGKDKRRERRNRADERNAFWATLSPTEKLVALDRRLGEGIGAKVQRARLRAEVEGPPKKKGKR